MNRERLVQIVRHPTTKLVAIGAAGFVGGIVVGLVLASREDPGPPDRTPEEKEELDQMSTRLDEMRAKRLQRLAEVQEPEPEEEERILEILDNDEDVADRVVTRNVFAEAQPFDDDWDYEVEVKNRTSTEPYVLHKDEFYAEELDFTQHTYTYYNGDDIVADEEDKPIYNYPTILGELKFGHGSGDPKVVHIRNEKRKEEYEVVMEPGLFSVEVLGLEIESNDRVKNRNMEHSTPRRFKLKE